MNTEALFIKATKRLQPALSKLYNTKHKDTHYELISSFGYTGHNTISIKITPFNLIIDYSTQGKDTHFHSPSLPADNLITLLNYKPR